MDIREQRGIVLAATKNIRRYGVRWSVPSQSNGEKLYSVYAAYGRTECTCPDYETRRENCKHIYAVLYVMERERNADGSTTVVEAVAIAETHRPTYPQAWSAYNAAQTGEKEQFQSLLFNLCSGIKETPVVKTGWPSIPMPDALFSAIFKVYSTVSTRRFMTDLREAQAKGMIAKAPHYNSIINYLEKPELTSIIRGMIIQSSLPLRAIESDFATDSSGFSTSRFVRWFDAKYGKEQIKHDWVKAHVMVGVRTNVVTAVEIGTRNASDAVLFAPLVETTAKNFAIMEVSADKGYSSRANTDLVARLGAMPFIALKANTTGGVGGTFEQMFHYFMYRKEEFLQHYHKRSNVESAFSMMKRKFGDGLRSKTPVAMVNETLCKILCHNLVVLIHEMYELGIEPTFWEKPRVN